MRRGGIPVRIPAPQRYAVHKLAVLSKRDKDVRQAELLVEALVLKRRHLDLASAWAEAWGRGPAWRDALVEGRSLMVAVRDGCRERGWTPGDL